MQKINQYLHVKSKDEESVKQWLDEKKKHRIYQTITRQEDSRKCFVKEIKYAEKSITIWRKF